MFLGFVQVPLEEILALAAAAESGSEHPLASAVLDYAAAVLAPHGLSAASTGGRNRSFSAGRVLQTCSRLHHGLGCRT